MKKLLILLFFFIFITCAYSDIYVGGNDGFTASVAGQYRYEITVDSVDFNPDYANYAYYIYPKINGVTTSNFLIGCVTTGTYPASNSGTLNLNSGDVVTVFLYNIPPYNFVYSASYTVSFYRITSEEGNPPVITSSTSVNTDGGSFVYYITASGDSPITYGASGLPSLLTFNGENKIQGNVSENCTFTVTATNPYGSDSKLVTVTINPPSGQAPVITSSTSVSAVCGQSFTYTTTATGTETIIYSVSGLPSYLTGNGSSISGTIPVSLTDVSFTFTVTATNDYGSDSKLVTVNAAAGVGTGHFDSDDDVPAINSLKDAVELFNSDFDAKMNGVYDRLDYIEDFFAPIVQNGFDQVHNEFDTVLTGMDLIITLLEHIKNNTSSSSFSGDDTALPDYEFNTDWGEFTVPYTDEEKKAKATIPQFTFLNDKFSELLAVQPGEAYKFEVTLVGAIPGVTENPYIIISQNEVTSPYITSFRMFFSVILYIVGLFWWTKIIMGYFA